MTKYQKKLVDYLRWRTGTFLRPNDISYTPNGLSPDQIMKDWESKGIPIPYSTNNPTLLSDYIQGKRSRDWHITEWRLGIKEGLFKPEEFIGTLGCDNIESLL